MNNEACLSAIQVGPSPDSPLPLVAADRSQSLAPILAQNNPKMALRQLAAALQISKDASADRGDMGNLETATVYLNISAVNAWTSNFKAALAAAKHAVRLLR